jgi:tetratricopeptide (TPR) repeat protein
MSARTILTALVLAAALTAAPRLHGQQEAVALPPEECVRMLREARLAGALGDEAAELEHLRAAVETFPREVSVLYALIEYGRRHPLPSGERGTILARLRERLADPALPLAAGVVRRIAIDPDADDVSLRVITEGVGLRVVGAGAGQEAPWLAVLAQLQTRLGEIEAAAETLERLWRAEPADDVAWSLFTLYRELDRSREAAALIDASAALREALPQVHVQLLIEAGRHDDAVRRVEEILGDLDPENLMAPRFLADVAWHLRDAGRDAEAEGMFRRVLALDPDHADARGALLHLYAHAEERAEHLAAAARRWREEDDPQALLDEGTQRLAAGDAEGALELLEWSVPHFPRLEPAWFNLGMAAYRAERWPTVDQAFARAAELNPERAASFFFRGIALVHLERCGEAIPVLERSLELDAERYQAHYYLAGCYRQLGDAAAADGHEAHYQATRPE